MTAFAELFAAPVAAALLIWWLGTGVVLIAERLGPRFAAARAIGAGLALATAIGLCVWSLERPTALGAYAGFAAGVAIWGWHELAFLLGWITGPNTRSCAEGARGWRRFVSAAGTLIHHELALAGTLIALAAVSWEATNPMAALAFGALWVMRLSAKLNLFLGVPNVSAEFAPPRLRHMASYFRTRRMNALFPVSIAGGTAAAAAAAYAAAMSATPFERVGGCLLATLLGLAVLEHWFMVLPIRDTLLWRWALGPRDLGCDVDGDDVGGERGERRLAPGPGEKASDLGSSERPHELRRGGVGSGGLLRESGAKMDAAIAELAAPAL